MRISELINKLQEIKNICGDTEVFLWNPTQLKHVPVESVYFPVAEDLPEGCEDDTEFMEDFNNILEHAIIL